MYREKYYLLIKTDAFSHFQKHKKCSIFCGWITCWPSVYLQRNLQILWCLLLFSAHLTKQQLSQPAAVWSLGYHECSTAVGTLVRGQKSQSCCRVRRSFGNNSFLDKSVCDSFLTNLTILKTSFSKCFSFRGVWGVLVQLLEIYVWLGTFWSICGLLTGAMFTPKIQNWFFFLSEM